jgi:hypothetical protein
MVREEKLSRPERTQQLPPPVRRRMLTLCRRRGGPDSQTSEAHALTLPDLKDSPVGMFERRVASPHQMRAPTVAFPVQFSKRSYDIRVIDGGPILSLAHHRPLSRGSPSGLIQWGYSRGGRASSAPARLAEAFPSC